MQIMNRSIGMTAIRTLVSALGASAIALSLVPVGAPVGAQEAAPDPDWPCDQVLVPQVAAAVVWDGPAITDANWRAVPAVAELVGRITPSTVTSAQAESAIASFADAAAPADKDRMLTLAFAGVLEVLNSDRQILIDGIKRYSRDQARRAQALGAELDRMVRLEQDPAASAAQERDDLKRRLVLEERAFDEREKTFPFLCTRPVAVEQRLGFLARTLAGHLD
jgi:hypothetical protein